MPPEVSPLDHHPDHVRAWCPLCRDLHDNPTRCPGWTAHRTRARFHAEAWEHGTWTGIVSGHDILADTVVQFDHKRRRFPDVPMRLMAALTVYLPVAYPTDPAEQTRQLLDSSMDTVALLTRGFAQERDRALRAEDRVRQLEEDNLEAAERAQTVIDSLRNEVVGRTDDDGCTEDREYGVVGGWGVEGANGEEDARRRVRDALAQYPGCGARARWRTVRNWDDGAEYYGPWYDLETGEPE
ncbi:hypothetical protein ACIA7S_28480 [Streptomyces sp. NPDC051643]|uniref:hypothetical protein n=1 Tax=Streptomyces sp. NPDC051643 TaxID=3365665 RepID=UPI0037AF65E4